MKNIKKVLGLLMVALFMFMPIITFASEEAEKIDLSKYTTLDLKEVLAAESIEEKFKTYEPAEDAINIYLFRGDGCGYCRSFLTFLNENTEEYGKYFNLVSFESWSNSDNQELLSVIGEFLGEDAQGVPYIIIGDQVFPGYTESYGDTIKTAIKTLYDSKDRYDVFEEYNKYLDEVKSEERAEKLRPVIWNFVFVSLGTVIILYYINKTKKEIITEMKKQNRRPDFIKKPIKKVNKEKTE